MSMLSLYSAVGSFSFFCFSYVCVLNIFCSSANLRSSSSIPVPQSGFSLLSSQSEVVVTMDTLGALSYTKKYLFSTNLSKEATMLTRHEMFQVWGSLSHIVLTTVNANQPTFSSLICTFSFCCCWGWNLFLKASI